MSEPIVRPTFFEGQVLAAADLEAAVEHPRGEAARDRRYLHTPGIATGLVLSGQDRKTPAGESFQEVTLSAGVAVDRTGRQIVLAADTRLDEQLFIDQGVQVKKDPTAFYPLFLRGQDRQAPADPSAACATTGATRVIESAEIEFGRPGAELEINNGEPPQPADGVANPSELVLVGFVQWDGQLQKFKRASLTAAGVGPTFAGSLADEVVARDGRLTMRSRRGVDKPALAIDEADGGFLVFGPQDARGRVVPAFKVDTRGNVTTQGKITSAATAGSVRVQSGVITDGVVVPLPSGIRQEDVAAGRVALQIHLTTRFPSGPPPAVNPAALWITVPLECRLEGPSRRVRCTVRWFLADQPTTFVDQPGASDYTVIATVLSQQEGQP